MTTRRSFMYGTERIEYDVVFIASRLKKVSIHVHPDGSVRVDAPEETGFADIHQAVMKRAGWIKQHLVGFRRQREQALPRGYVSGESLVYLGRRYQLKVREGSISRVKLLRGQICVETPSRAAEDVKSLVVAWYRNRASEVFRGALRRSHRASALATQAAHMAACPHEDAMGKLFADWRDPS